MARGRDPRWWYRKPPPMPAVQGPAPPARSPPCVRLAAGDAPGAELPVLAQRAEPEPPRLGAEGRGGQVVLNLEHRLAGPRERLQACAFAVLEALLVERPVERRHRVAVDRLDAVLHADGEAAPVRLTRHLEVPRLLVG